MFPSLNLFLQDPSNLTLNTRLSGKLEHILSRRFGVGIDVHTLQTRAQYDYLNRIGSMSISGKSAGIFASLYRFVSQGNIAPIGPFQRFGINYLRYELKDLDGRFFPDNRSVLPSGNLWKISYTLGTQRVFAEYLVLNLSMQVAWVGTILQSSWTPEERYLASTVSSRMRGFYALNGQIGIGVLLF
ncbi:hypothetical protein [Pontibacter sp. G13]|uniref:hypothetical protein n=1 Tax=Pontibacter sp. G13 TaxID=3074898 RepID=UPI00288AA67C|nr:hypothetical protein [Pontibacter sp. G13]WNJ15952.1 hypothetical protein RJD25_13905 [Pontibacter sp. G13]